MKLKKMNKNFILISLVTLLLFLSTKVHAQTAPVVSDIPDQTIAEGASFATINLDDYVTDVDPGQDPEDMVWSYSGNVNLTVSINGSRVATITIPNTDWNGSETITFTAEDPDTLTGNDSAEFTVTAVNDAPVVTNIPNQTIAEGGALPQSILIPMYRMWITPMRK